jgi:uncharacterized protein YgiM (DUF1202 family)
MTQRLTKAATLFLAAGTLSLWTAGVGAEIMQVVDVPAGDTLNIRQGPNASSVDIGDIAPDAQVEVLGFNMERSWARVLYQNQTGWVAARYLAASEVPKAAIGANVVISIKANDPDGGLVVRGAAGTSSARLGVLPDASQVHVIQFGGNGDWAMIAFEAGVGWVSSAYLSSMTSSSALTPSARPSVAPDGGPLPAIFTVTGVSAGDKLWVRSAPQATAGRVGGLTPGSVVNVEGRASGSWGKITLNGQAGYINMSYITRAVVNGVSSIGASATANGFPLGLACRGTEPFWTLDINEDRSFQYTSLINGPDPLRYLAIATPALSGGYPFDFAAHPLAGVIDQQSCSDGMSDTAYTMSIQLNRPSGNGVMDVLYGCCSVQ